MKRRVRVKVLRRHVLQNFTAGEFVGATLVVVPAWQPRGLPLRRCQFASGIKLWRTPWKRQIYWHQPKRV